MDNDTLKAFTDRTTGAITALETQLVVLLATTVRSGIVKPDVIERMLDELHAPALAVEADVAYSRGMARFRQALGIAMAEAIDGLDEPT